MWIMVESTTVTSLGLLSTTKRRVVKDLRLPSSQWWVYNFYGENPVSYLGGTRGSRECRRDRGLEEATERGERIILRDESTSRTVPVFCDTHSGTTMVFTQG